MTTLNRGDTAPDFSLQDQNGKTVSLKNFTGKKVLLYFYPKADTPGCTKQACSVRDAAANLKTHGITALGISADPPSKQQKFDAKYNLGFRLLSDPDNSASRAYGAWGEKSMYGKKYEGIIRSSFLIDESGKIAQVSYKVKPEDTVPNVLGTLA